MSLPQFSLGLPWRAALLEIRSQAISVASGGRGTAPGRGARTLPGAGHHPTSHRKRRKAPAEAPKRRKAPAEAPDFCLVFGEAKLYRFSVPAVNVVVAVGSQKAPLNRGNGSGNFFLVSQGDRVPDWLETRSQGHWSVPENPFVVGVWRFRATLYEGEGGALCGALLPVTVFLAVKATGGSGLARWELVLLEGHSDPSPK